MALDAIEAEERRLDTAWGNGRARLCLAPDVRARFDAQAERLWRASREADLPTLLAECTRMTKALAAAEKAAQACGVLLPGVWEATLADGSTLAIVQHREHAQRVRARDRTLEVWTVEEIAHLVEGQDAPVRALKRRFGAIVASMQATPLADPDAISATPFVDDDIDSIRW
jgi:hypothetical protein